jgi:hypothetical protein
MDLIHHLHTGSGTAAGLVKLSFESISVLCGLCVALGLVISLGLGFNNLLRTGRSISRPPSGRWNSAPGWQGPGSFSSAPASWPLPGNCH